ASSALDLVARSTSQGAPLASVNLGGGFAVDYSGGDAGPDLRALATGIAGLTGADRVEWCFEPGRWLVAQAGLLVSEVLWDKRRIDPAGESRFVVLAAGMNDLLRPALYSARHRLVVLSPREGASSPADVVGPVCESADRFLADEPLPALEPGDLVALCDTGAYGSVMSSNYNGRSRLGEIVQVNGELVLARAPEAPADRVAALGDEVPLH
ncbi:MAG: diaminopimelate decarboxylase, partial [bacterium]